MTRAPLVVGIDPSLTATGIAYSTGQCYKVGRAGITTLLPLSSRVVALDELVFRILGELPSADLYVIEWPTKSKFTAGQLERNALWWLLVRELESGMGRLAVVSPTNRMQYATGKGSADKGAVIDAVARRLPQFETKGDDNLADAAIFCAMGMDHLGFPLAVMPAAHRKALSAVDWPECPPWTEI